MKQTQSESDNFTISEKDIKLICKKCKSDWTIPLNSSWLEPCSSYKLICPICKVVFGVFITNEKEDFWGIGYISEKKNKDG